MAEIIISASAFMNNISNIFSGTYKSENEDYIRMKKEVLDLTIPTIEDDRLNTTSDISKIGNDLRKAIKDNG